jgi:hypothetical protein
MHLIENFDIRKFGELAANEGERETCTGYLTMLAICCMLQKAEDMGVVNCRSQFMERR